MLSENRHQRTPMFPCPQSILRRLLVVTLAVFAIPLPAPAREANGDAPPRPPVLTPDQQQRLDEALKRVSATQYGPKPEFAAALEKALAVERDLLGPEDLRTISI